MVTLTPMVSRGRIGISGKGACAVLGLRVVAEGGWAVVVARSDGGPRCVGSFLLPRARDEDLGAARPFAAFFAAAQGGEGRMAEAVLALTEARKRQDEAVRGALSAALARCAESGVGPERLVLLVNRAGWIGDLISYSLAYPEHAAVADGLCLRQAFRAAAAALALPVREMDEKTLPVAAAAVLGLGAAEIQSHLKKMGEGLKPWRKEQKLACLAAWTSLWQAGSA